MKQDEETKEDNELLARMFENVGKATEHVIDNAKDSRANYPALLSAPPDK